MFHSTNIVRIVAACGVVLGALALDVPRASGQEAFCIGCNEERWKAVETQMVKRAANLKSARDLVRKAEAAGDASLITGAKALLAKTTAEWDEVNTVASTLGSPTYKAHLARHQVDTETRFDDARAELARKTEQFDRFRKKLVDQREGTLREMDGIIRDEDKKRWTLGLNGAFTAVEGLAHGAKDMADRLRAASNASNLPLIQKLDQFVRLELAVRGIRAGQEGSHEHWLLAREFARVTLPIVAERAAPALVQGATAVPAILTLALDAVDIGLSHVEFHAAAERLQNVGNIEARWQADVSALGARVNNLRAERALADDAIQRQIAFERQAQTIRAGLGQ